MRPSAVALVAALVLVLAATPAAARFGMPEPLTDRGKIVEDIYVQITIAGILVFILVFALLVWVLVRYREGSGKGRSTHEKHRGSIKAELVWTILPLAVMLWIGVMSYAGLVQLDEGLGSEDYDMEVKIIGRQWLWEMDYGDGVLVSVTPNADPKTGEMTYSDTFHLPADTRILLNLTGADVIHAFNILDGNRAYVTMDDANPSGPHKYHEQVMEFPAGKYTIQCKEMCLNPGHAYMRAELIVESPADFAEWKADRAILGDAALTQFIDVTVNNGKVTYAEAPPEVVVAGTRVGIKVTNAGTQTVKFDVDDADIIDVAPGEVVRRAFDAAGGQTYNVSFSPGTSFELEAVVPDVELDIDLGDFFLDPSSLQLQVGKGYLFRATNVGGSTHNLFFGTFGGEVLAASSNAGPGGVAMVFFKPTEAGTIDMWCNVPGHHGLGMFGTVTITA